MYEQIEASDENEGPAGEVPSLGVRNHAGEKHNVVEQDEVGRLVHDFECIDARV